VRSARLGVTAAAAQPAFFSLVETLQSSVDPLLESVGSEPFSHVGSDSSSQEKTPLGPLLGVLPSSQAASGASGAPFGAGPQISFVPLGVSIGVEPFSQPGSDSSSQEKKPSLSLTGRLPSSQTAGVWIVPVGAFAFVFTVGAILAIVVSEARDWPDRRPFQAACLIVLLATMIASIAVSRAKTDGEWRWRP